MSTTPSAVARSSGEAEYFAAVKGAAAGMALRSLFGNLDLKVVSEVNAGANGGEADLQPPRPGETQTT